MRKDVASVLLFFLLLSLVGFDANASDFPYGMSEEEAWRIVDSVRAEYELPELEQITPLTYAKNISYGKSDILIVYYGLPSDYFESKFIIFGLPKDKTVNIPINIRINLGNRTGEVDLFNPHSPSIEDIKNFFDTAYVSNKLSERFPNPNDTLTYRYLYYAGVGSGSECLKYYGLFYRFYTSSDFAEYLYLKDGRVRRKCEMASGGKWGEQ
jgi:hypothetical protein